MRLPRLLAPSLATAARRRLRPSAAQFADFKGHLAGMRRHLDPTKIERHAQLPILSFMLAVTRPIEGGSRYGNVSGKRDLVLHLGDPADTPVAGVPEAKAPRNPAATPDEQAAIAALVTQILAAKAAAPAADPAAAAVDARVAARHGVARPAAGAP